MFQVSDLVQSQLTNMLEKVQIETNRTVQIDEVSLDTDINDCIIATIEAMKIFEKRNILVLPVRE